MSGKSVRSTTRCPIAGQVRQMHAAQIHFRSGTGSPARVTGCKPRWASVLGINTSLQRVAHARNSPGARPLDTVWQNPEIHWYGFERMGRIQDGILNGNRTSQPAFSFYRHMPVTPAETLGIAFARRRLRISV